MSTNQQRAAEVIREARMSAPRTRGMDDTISPHIAQELADAGLLAPDLPEPVMVQPGMVASPECVVFFPRDEYSLPVVSIVGDADLTDAVQEGAGDASVVAIAPEHIDVLIGHLMAARDHMHHTKENPDDLD